jgi:hypothetical protein
MERSTEGYAIECYDPRQNEDFAINVRTGERFSSLENGFFAVSIYRNRLSVTEKEKLAMSRRIDQFVESASLYFGGLGFFAFSPFTKSTRKANVFGPDEVDKMSGSILGYFEISPPRLDDVIIKCRSVHTYEEWTIGVCRAEFERPKKKSRWFEKAVLWDEDYLLLQADNINLMAGHSGDTDVALILTRVFDGIDEALRPLYGE